MSDGRIEEKEGPTSRKWGVVGRHFLQVYRLRRRDGLTTKSSSNRDDKEALQAFVLATGERGTSKGRLFPRGTPKGRVRSRVWMSRKKEKKAARGGYLAESSRAREG